MTTEQRDILKYIMDNKIALEELFETINKEKQVKDLKMKESIIVAGTSWSKFAEDSKGNAYMLADENISYLQFGNNNDWRESPVREILNGGLYEKHVFELGTGAFVTIQTDLLSHDGLRDYGKCEDNVSLLTYDLYRNNRENIKFINSEFWTCTPHSTSSGINTTHAGCVLTNGDVCQCGCGYLRGVRPFFILKSDIFVSVKI